MSGFQNITGFAPPTSFGGFMSLLQNAMWRGIPFHVTGAVVRKGRKQAVHNYSFRDGVWVEDMGRAPRQYSFSGYLIGDLAPAMQLALDAACEARGPGMLIHPTIGAVRCSLTSCASSVRRDAMRVIEVQFEFLEAGEQIFPVALIGAAVGVLASVASALIGVGSSLGGVAAASHASASTISAGKAAGTAFANAALGYASDPAMLVAMPIGMVAADGFSLGRYNVGNATVRQADSVTVPALQADIAVERDQVAQLGDAAVVAIGGTTQASAQDVIDALDAMTDTMRQMMTDPADQTRTLLILAGFTYVIPNTGSYIGADIAGVGNAVVAACRRVALANLARASSSYQPHSYDDAAAQRALIAAAFDAEITVAGDAGDDDAYTALKDLRSGVVADLTRRGASLPPVATVAFRTSLPALTLAQMLYRDASRSDELVGEAAVPHPAFMPLSFKALAA
jgi:prophage DNA circulation protein